MEDFHITCTHLLYYLHNIMYMCVSIEAADVCLQCTRTMCNIECCRFTTVKESSVCYTYIIQEEALNCERFLPPST